MRQKINVSDVVLALIGPRWLTATDDEGRWRLADENDLGGAVVFLLGDASRYITGVNLPVDGGYTAK